jgi:hypothetical protein
MLSAISKLGIPAQTKSLLWVTQADPSLAVSQTTIYVKLTLGDEGISSETVDPTEPSCVFAKLPVSQPEDIQTVPRPPYWPSYAELSAQQRWIYLDWLRDVRKPVDLGYVFVYFYGLERHLVFKDFDAATAEILLLLEYHSKSSFPFYAKRALMAAAILRDRFDLFQRLPWLLDETDPVAFWVRRKWGYKLKPQDVINLRYLPKFYKTDYIRKYPNKFSEILGRKLDLYEEHHQAHLLLKFGEDELPRVRTSVFANRSLPDQVREPELPDILQYGPFKQEIGNLLMATHEELKFRLAAERKASRRTKVPNRVIRSN